MFLYVFWSLIASGFAQKQCNEESSCVGEDITELSTLVYCNGFNSCSETTIKGGSYFVANGAFSAFNAKNITTPVSSLCEGESSCRNVSYLKSSNIRCGGESSCFASTMINPSNVQLYGYKSGAYSTINLYVQDSVILISGALSLYNANINMYISLTLGASQDYALKNANIYCDSGQTCSIECYGYGCANISSATGNGTYNITCTYNLVPNILCSSNDIADGLSIDIEKDLPSALIGSLMNPNIDDNLQYNNDVYSMYQNLSHGSILGINCGDVSECSSTSLNYINKAIGCTSFNGCYNATVSLTVNNSQHNNYNYSTNHSIVNLMSIYCGGVSSGEVGEFKMDVPFDDSNLFSIHCNGVASCHAAKQLSGANNVFCAGDFSCGKTIIMSMARVFGTGYSSLFQTQILNTRNDIYCIAMNACAQSYITNTSGNIYGFGYQSMKSATVRNSLNDTVVEKMYLIGYETGHGISIYNVESLYGSGHEVLRESIISGIRNLYVSGTNSLHSSRITTQFNLTNYNYNPRVILDIEGHVDGTYNVECSVGDECYIQCKSQTSCTNMALVCNGICYLDCGNYTNVNTNAEYIYNQCPTNITGNWTYGKVSTQNPTTFPTAIPTADPTFPASMSTSMPTIIPTIMPTVIPTTDPTVFKTIYGMTNSPTVIPVEGLQLNDLNFTFSYTLDILLNSTIQHTDIDYNYSILNVNNKSLANNIVASLEEISYLVANIDNKEITIIMQQMLSYNDSETNTVHSKCVLQKSDSIQETDQYVSWQANWIRMNVTFIDFYKLEQWENKLEYIIGPFDRLLSKSDYFINDTILISYCQSQSQDINVFEDEDSKDELKSLTIFVTVCVLGSFIIIGICGCIDAVFCRQNEVFSIGAVISSATYTVDIVSGK